MSDEKDQVEYKKDSVPNGIDDSVVQNEGQAKDTGNEEENNVRPRPYETVKPKVPKSAWALFSENSKAFFYGLCIGIVIIMFVLGFGFRETSEHYVHAMATIRANHADEMATIESNYQKTTQYCKDRIDDVKQELRRAGR